MVTDTIPLFVDIKDSSSSRDIHLLFSSYATVTQHHNYFFLYSYTIDTPHLFTPQLFQSYSQLLTLHFLTESVTPAVTLKTVSPVNPRSPPSEGVR